MSPLPARPTLLEIDLEEIRKALFKQFGARKAKAAELNWGAVKAGRDFAQKNLTKTDPLRVERMNETSGKIIIEWDNFDIARGQKVVFDQPNAVAAALNRVLSGAKTTILGSLTANGQIIITNPKGIVFGASARVDGSRRPATSRPSKL